MKPLIPKLSLLIPCLTAGLLGVAQAQFTYTGNSTLNAAQTYDGLGVDSGLNPWAIGTTGDGDYIGNGGTGSITVLSGSLSITNSDFKVGVSGGTGALYLGQNATLNLECVGQWAPGVGQNGGSTGRLAVSNNATLNINIGGAQEQRMTWGVNGGTIVADILGGTINVNNGTGTADNDRSFNVGAQNGQGTVNLIAGTITDNMPLPFSIGGRYGNMNSSPTFNDSTTASTMVISNGSFVMTAVCPTTDGSKATFTVGANSYVVFYNGTGSLSLTNWSSSDYQALVDSGKIRIGLPGQAGIVTSMSSFTYTSVGGQGILKVVPFTLSLSIVTQPASQTVYEGNALTLTVAASGPNPSYQWKAGAQGSGIYTNIPGATNTTFTVAYARPGNTADYVVYVSNSSSSVTSDVASVTVSAASYVNGLFNGDFELPNTQKINSGFDVSGANDVPGWRNAGPNQNDTGIENPGQGHTGTWTAFLRQGQSGAYQITPTTLNLNDTVTLTWWARDSWMGVKEKVSLVSATSQEAAFGSTTTLAYMTNDLVGTWWTQYTINYTVGAGDVGKLIGVAFQTTEPSTGNGWANIDDFTLTITAPTAAPVIITQPTSRTAWLAGTTTFNVLASGSGLNYQWKAGVVGSGIYTNISNGGQFSGANTASLTVSNIVVENGLDYVVTISNTGGAVTSDPATLTVDTSAPLITTQPAAAARFTTESVSFTVTATGGVTYQWKAGAVGSGIYTNLSNGGQLSGVNAATLTITNLQTANQADYVVVVSNGSGSETSVPATLTVTTIIYIQNFETTNATLPSLGWAADAQSGNSVIGDNIAAGGRCIFDANGQTNQPEAFYTSTVLNNAFPVIKLADVPAMTLYVDLQSWWHAESVHSYFAVQMNWGQWYVSTSELPQPTGTQTTLSMAFDPTSSAWNQLTVSGTGGPNSASIPLVGAGATANLTGYMTGAGVVTSHDQNTDGSSWVIIDNFKIAGNGYTLLPGLSLAKSGANLVLTWGYGTLVESTNLMGPWTPVSGTSPKTVSPTDASHFYRLQLP